MEKPPKLIHLTFCEDTIGRYHTAIVLEKDEPLPYVAPTCPKCIEMVKNGRT